MFTHTATTGLYIVTEDFQVAVTANSWLFCYLNVGGNTMPKRLLKGVDATITGTVVRHYAFTTYVNVSSISENIIIKCHSYETGSEVNFFDNSSDFDDGINNVAERCGSTATFIKISGIAGNIV